MAEQNQRDQELKALQQRLTQLSEASLRINKSLEFDTVLQGVLDSARDLTAARYGVMTLLDEGGQIADFLSSGTTAEEAERLWLTPDPYAIFESLTEISGPLRVTDLTEHVRSLGFAEFEIPVPVEVFSFLAVPMLFRGDRVGHLFVGAKDGGAEFTRADEETLVMFASQAALVTANARRHRNEQRTRADLETLVNTSPVGVVVIDAASGELVLFNREAARLVESLRESDQPLEQLLETVTCVRADGRELSLGELSLSELLGASETIRAEEIVLRVPDGSSVSALLNATPIRSDDGVVASLVVTLQDLTPLDEQERLRAEFLAMVSHELRTPLAAVMGSVNTLLDSSDGLDPAESTQFLRIIRDQSDQMRHLIGDLLDVARINTGTLPVTPEPADIHQLADDARGRFLTGGAGHPVNVDLAPGLPLVMADRRRIAQVLSNLLFNAAGYSPDGSPIEVRAARDGTQVAISVTDQGRGIPSEQMPDLFRKFSRAHGPDHGTGVAGSGLGLAICRGIVEAHGGRIWAESDGAGLGARFTFTLPPAEAATTTAVPGLPGSRPSAQRQVRVLAVDDDPQALRYITDILAKAGYATVATGNPADIGRIMAEEKPHLVLLDLVLPDRDGIEVMSDVRARADVPVIFLSAYGHDETIARAFDMGAADYVVKPFSPTELTARIRAALRKQVDLLEGEPSAPYEADGLSIDYARRRAAVSGEPVDLTATEYNVLHELAANAPRVLTHSALLHRVWGPERVGEPWLVRDVIKRLRRKLGDDASNPSYIFTEPRVGYRMPPGQTED
ncbi:ATP-binding protein [Candidatus Poriferisodalis sp.]|uniref:hybrid sensor histidine kinase/response regulator n=1 Tax=Candidatus Poriferisodalis sp. TaxID=3101277 RepID=UPI003B02D139